jgi:putative addiction module component (TIGR02574 family)
MSASFDELGIDRLSIDERIALAQEILDSVVAARRLIALSDKKRQELDRRLENQKLDPSALVPWETIDAETETRLKKDDC